MKRSEHKTGASDATREITAEAADAVRRITTEAADAARRIGQDQERLALAEMTALLMVGMGFDEREIEDTLAAQLGPLGQENEDSIRHLVESLSPGADEARSTISDEALAFVRNLLDNKPSRTVRIPPVATLRARRRSVDNEAASQPDVDDSLGATLRSTREGAGLTLPDLAEQSGVSLAFLSQVENGRSVPRRAKFERVVEVLARDDPHADHLRARRDWQELVDRFGLSEGVAALVVLLKDEGRSSEALQTALEGLTPEQRTALYEALRDESVD